MPVTVGVYETCVAVPEVVSQQYELATALLKRASLVAARTDVCVPGVANGIVKAADPEVGTAVPVNSTVTLTVTNCLVR
jgi:beta-lactam-binding protein with PASTA domain